MKTNYPKKSQCVKKRRKKTRKGLIALASILSLGLWFGYRRSQAYFLSPDTVLVLGGHETRERFAAELALEHPNLHIWVSSGSPPEYVNKIFTNRGIESDRLHLDYRAIDTVTNFTTLVDELKAQGIDSIYLVTSDNHMPRAILIGEIVFGSRGIAIKPIAVPSDHPPEPMVKLWRDGTRAIIWLTTGYTGS